MNKELALNNMEKNELISDLKVKMITYQKALEFLENLKCCGNCKDYTMRQCFYYSTYILKGDWQQPENYCSQWVSDGMTREQREIK